jgi:ADP-heptose:LPS heptosyltransferase/predicted SAM-dependent methyltransferase
MTWKRDDPQGNEAAKIRWELVQWTRGRVLDIGCGMYKAFPHFIGVDNCADTRLFGHPIKPDVFVTDASDLGIFADAQFDAVFSSHLLEHIEQQHVVKTLKEWLRVIKAGGYLILYLPDETLYPKVGEEGANPDHKWNVSYKLLVELMQATRVSWDLVDWQRRDAGQEYSLFFVFKKLEETDLVTGLKVQRQTFSCATKEPITAQRACVVRYGATGDMIQASSVLAGLKQQGYHVTLMTAPPGNEVVAHDPNIDELYLQDKDQVPNQELGPYWDYHKKRFDKWVNLSESVEGTLLVLYPRMPHLISPAARHMVCNSNYLEFQHAIAGVPHKPQVAFYPTAEETKWAKAERRAFGRDTFLVVYALNGSSVHKRWPWMDSVITALLMDFPDLHVVLVGGVDGQILEQGWFGWDKDPAKHDDAKKVQTNPRVHCRSGRWEIRQTLAFLEQADMVFGPETGILNAAAQLPIPKVLLLSHSSVENLARDWVNCHAIASGDTECPGRGKNEAPACHQMHYDFTFCRQATFPKEHPTEAGKPMGVAQCMYDLDFESAYRVVWHAVTWEKERKAGKPVEKGPALHLVGA